MVAGNDEQNPKKDKNQQVLTAHQLKSPFTILDNRISFYDIYRLFYGYFGSVLPSIQTIWALNPNKVGAWIEDEFVPNQELLDELTFESFSHGKKKLYIRHKIWIFVGGLLLELQDNGHLSVLYQHEMYEAAHKVIEEVKSFLKKDKGSFASFYVLKRGNFGNLELAELRYEKPRLSLLTHYNDDVLLFYDSFIRFLKEPLKSGIHLLHGVPGSGKSTLLKYVLHRIGKTCIYMSPKLAGSLESPDIVEIILENKGAIFLIEDAESLIKRKEDGNNGLSFILNLADGFLGDALGTQIIATSNSNLNQIDTSLLRKGRLLSSYEFSALEIHKTNRLLEKITGKPGIKSNRPLTLAEIYNFSSENGSSSFQNYKSIGFNTTSE